MVATDELSNPPDRVTRDAMESSVVLVDNTPPVVEGLKVVGKRVQGVALDGVGPIARIEIALAGSDEWTPFLPDRRHLRRAARGIRRGREQARAGGTRAAQPASVR